VITATVEQILSYGPCAGYTEGRLRWLWGCREKLSQDEIAALDVNLFDRIWVLSRMLYDRSPWRANRVSRRVALDVAHLWDCPDIVWWYLVTGYEAARKAALMAAARATKAHRGASSYAAFNAAVGNADGCPMCISWAADLSSDVPSAFEKYMSWILEVM
jgi:hypothetical protein